MSQSKELDCLNNVASSVNIVCTDRYHIFVYVPGINIAY